MSVGPCGLCHFEVRERGVIMSWRRWFVQYVFVTIKIHPRRHHWQSGKNSVVVVVVRYLMMVVVVVVVVVVVEKADA
jgi:hypothetical protein